MKFESFIAKRYLVSRHKINFISIISVISISGITVGVAALLVVLSVFNGFSSLVTNLLMNLDPQIRIEILDKEKSQKYESIQTKISTKNIVSSTPYVSGKAIANRNGINQVVNVKGISEESGSLLYSIDKNIIYGRLGFNEDEEIEGIVLGLRLADRLETIIGDTITIISPAGIENAIVQGSLPNMQKFIVSGIFSSRNNIYDASYIFCSVGQAQNLFGFFNRVQGIELKLNDINNSNNFKESVTANLGSKDYKVSTWYDLHKELYDVMQIERWVAYIILSLIIAVATFNILGSLSMSVIEKKRDIGIIISMGGTQKSILKIFMFEGLLIGILGTLLGLALGYIICLVQINYNIYPLDPTQYKISSLPIELRVSDFFYVGGASMLLSILTSLYPARRAAKINPLEAIKWE